MATPTIRSTYSLDVETVRLLEEMARRWHVPKSEALRRAIRKAAQDVPDDRRDALTALDELQKDMALSEAQARSWAREVRTERRASSDRKT